MVRSSGIRDKIRSASLKDLARERAIKKSKHPFEYKASAQKDKNQELDSETDSDDHDERKELANAKTKNTSGLISLLPKPKNSSAFGPTVDIEKLLRMPERASDTQVEDFTVDDSIRTTEDGILEFDVSKVVCEPVISSTTKFEEVKSKVVVPKGKEKQKNQITYLAQLGKANELERKEQAALGRLNKAQARSKYGW